MTPQTVGKWRARFLKARLDGLLDEPRPGAPRTVSDEQVERVIAKTLHEKPREATHWSSRMMPDTGKRRRVMRPQSEWISYVDESLRIVSDALWERAQRRTRPAKDEGCLRAGGKPKYLLSGLLRCDVCDVHYTITDAVSYGCSSYHDGHARSSSIRVRRARVEHMLLRPIRLPDGREQVRVGRHVRRGWCARRRDGHTFDLLDVLRA